MNALIKVAALAAVLAWQVGAGLAARADEPSPGARAAEPKIVRLWPGRAPDEIGGIGPERERMSPRLEVSVEIDPARHADAVQLLTSLDGLTVSSERGGVLRVGGVPRERVPDVAAHLVSRGIRLYRLEPHEPSLTDAYFALQQTGGGIT